jgi:5-methylcytosine-specific restriction protein A
MTGNRWDHGGKTRHDRGYGTAWNKLRGFILQRDKHLCQACLRKGRPTPGNHVDHINPKAKGGTDEPDNLELLCRPCHDRKTIREKGHKPKPTTGLSGWPIEE